MTVFVDTSALYALIAPHDGRHLTARSEFVTLLEDAALLTHNYVEVEAVSLVHARHGPRTVRGLREILDVVERVWVEEELHVLALDRLVANAREGPSFVDLVSFEVMDRYGLEAAFAFDEHFAAAGFRVLPPVT